MKQYGILAKDRLLGSPVHDLTLVDINDPLRARLIARFPQDVTAAERHDVLNRLTKMPYNAAINAALIVGGWKVALRPGDAPKIAETAVTLADIENEPGFDWDERALSRDEVCWQIVLRLVGADKRGALTRDEIMAIMA